MQKSQCLLFVLKRSNICFYVICMTVPLKPILENVIYFRVPKPRLMYHGLSSSFIKNVFHLNTNIPYDLRSRSELYCRNPKTVKYGTGTISYLAPKIWSLVPNAIKSSKLLDTFKYKIRKWEPDCHRCLCKNYLQHVGFI